MHLICTRKQNIVLYKTFHQRKRKTGRERLEGGAHIGKDHSRDKCPPPGEGSMSPPSGRERGEARTQKSAHHRASQQLQSVSQGHASESGPLSGFCGIRSRPRESQAQALLDLPGSPLLLLGSSGKGGLWKMSLPEKGIDCPNGLLLWELGKLLLFIFYYFYYYFLGGRGERMQNVCSENRILRSNRQSLLIYKKEEGKTGQGLRAVPAELMCKQVAGTAGWSPLQQVLLLVFVWARKEDPQSSHSTVRCVRPSSRRHHRTCDLAALLPPSWPSLAQEVPGRSICPSPSPHQHPYQCLESTSSGRRLSFFRVS